MLPASQTRLGADGDASIASPQLCGGWNFGPPTGTEYRVSELADHFCRAWGKGSWFDASRPGNGIQVTGKDVRAAIDAVLAGKPVSEFQTPSMGCNIKWKLGNEPEYYGHVGG